MKTNTALRLLAAVMDWDDPTAQNQFAWMRIMARLKYDDYRDFLAGMRFLESLVAWLQQFEKKDRPAAYDFVRNRLVYVSAAERQRLVELLYPVVIWPELVRSAEQATGVPAWKVLVDTNADKHVQRDLRSTLFLALSDGARLDAFRHANAGRISNEQVVVTIELAPDKWADLLKELRKHLDDGTAVFKRIVLVDDFTASGTSLVRQEGREWKGKLPRFLKSLGEVDAIGARVQLMIHHLIGTPQAQEHIAKAIGAFQLAEPAAWSRVLSNEIKISYGHLYPAELKITPETDPEFYPLTQTYYDKGIETHHTDKGGEKHLGMGYAKCALPLVLDHNTPNNSVALLWAESETKKRNGHDMRPLFRRRQRHS